MATTIDYLKILEESLNKKISVLQALLEATRRQSVLAEEESLDMDAFEGTMEQKDALLSQLTELDEGFENVFHGVEAELKDNKSKYRNEIERIQNSIRKCTDLSVELQALEERNKTKLAARFSVQQREIRQVKTSSKAASSYYKSMAGAQNIDSIFMDQKK
ncbi:MAG: flagellar export chaperone FlgN [Lachnospiraceae bacterium]|nr:flagellar export chaperone FlgN [Lachnospiraceae bacterium]